jgi:hypothetical protein
MVADLGFAQCFGGQAGVAGVVLDQEDFYGSTVVH